MTISNSSLKNQQEVSIGNIAEIEKKFGFLFAHYLKSVLSVQDDDQIIVSVRPPETQLVITTDLNSSFEWQKSALAAKDSEFKVAELLRKTFSQYGSHRLDIQFDSPPGKSHYDFTINSKTIDVKISKSNFEIEIARLDGTPSGIFNEQVAEYWIMIHPSFNKNDEPYRGSFSILSSKKWKEILSNAFIVKRYLVEYPDVNDYKKGRISVRIPYSELIDSNSIFYKNRVFIGEIQAKLSNSGKINAYDFAKFIEISSFFKKQYMIKKDLNFIQIVDYILSL